MYRRIVARQVRRMFEEDLSRGRWDAALAPTAERVHHVFPGEHPLGGERHDREAVRLWFERLGRLFPGHDFRVHDLIVRGLPWRTTVVVQWTADLRPAAGEAYANEGTHWIELRWGRVTKIHAYLDTQRVVEACERMAREGIEEAAAPPIYSASSPSQ